MKQVQFILYFLCLQIVAFAQNTQTIRGVVNDKQAETPLIGASVQVVGSNPIIGAVTNENGEYALQNVPLGRQQIAFSYIGYNTATIPNVVVNAGKEVVFVDEYGDVLPYYENDSYRSGLAEEEIEEEVLTAQKIVKI